MGPFARVGLFTWGSCLMFKRFFRKFAANTPPRNPGTHPALMRALAASIEPLEPRTLLSGQLPVSAAELGGLLDAQVTLQMVTASPPTSRQLFSGFAPRDLIFDRTRDQLLVVQPTRVERYGAASGELLDSIDVGLDLLGGDITPDGNFLYITERNSHSIYKVNLASKAVSSFIVSDYLGTPIDLSIGAGGAIAIISQAYQGSGDNLRTINLADDSIGDLSWKDIGPLSLSRPAILARSADYSYVAITSASDDHSFTSAGVWSERFQTRGDVSALAVSRNGDLHAISTPEGVYVVDDQIALVKTFSTSGAGVLFDPTVDVLYVADPDTDTLTGYDTNSWAELFSVAIGENLTPADPFGIGVMTASDDGEFIYLATFFGVRAFHMSGADSFFGRPVTFRADVSAPDTTGPQPGGSVTFIDATTGLSLGQGILVSGSASFTTTSLSPGNYSVFASYSGDAAFNPAESSRIPLQVTPASTSVSLVSTGASSARVTVNSPGGIPDSGTITVLDYRGIVGTATVHLGIADVDLAVSWGSQTLTVKYSGNERFLPSSADIVFFAKHPTSTTINIAPTTGVYGKNVHMEATVSYAGVPVGIGTVTFMDTDGFTQAVNVFDGIAILNTSTFSPGLHTITARFDGDQFNFFAPSTSAPIKLRIDIIPNDTKVKLTLSRTYVPAGQTIAFRAAVSSSTGQQITGKVIFKDGTRAIGTASIFDGVATLSIGMSVGTRPITATFNGNTYFKPSISKPIKLNVFSPITIDLMLLYTPQARESVVGPGLTMGKFITDALAATNQAFWNSQIPVLIRLRASQQVDYHESGKLDTDLSRLSRNTDGYMDAIHRIRNQVGADLVTLLESDGDFGGNAFELSDLHSSTNSARGFSVVLAGEAGAPYYTLAHELGHNFGATHDVGNAEGRHGATTFSNGWRFRGNDGVLYHDIMSYDPGETIPYFSNPRIKYKGVPIGNPNTADSARTITLTAPYVAAYRKTVKGVITIG